MSDRIKGRNYEIEYFVYGSGKKVLFAFHGFNNNAQEFSPLANAPENEYTVVAINIFFHGNSTGDESLVSKGFSTTELLELSRQLFSLFPSEKYTLLGYSLGGRLVLKMLELLPGRIEKIVLLAPDGIRISRFYLFLTGTAFGRILLKRVITNPSVFFKLAALLKSTGLVSGKKYHFAMGNFDSVKKRQMVYNVWMILRKIISKNTVVKRIAAEHQIPVLLFFGKYDQIIPVSVGKNFRKGSEKWVSLHVLESGHRLMKEKSLLEVAEKLRQIKNDVR